MQPLGRAAEVQHFGHGNKYGGMEMKDARKYRELEKENGELKKMLADSLLKIRVLEAVNAKNGGPFAEAASGPGRGHDILPILATTCRPPLQDVGNIAGRSGR